MNRTAQTISRSALLRRCYVTRTRNLYEILGITRAATATEIKGAYYKLSMLYHPDKNENNLEAAEKFREITAAYEVLGNFRSRKLYDKGIIHSSGENYRRQEQEEEDDPTARFYQARMKKEHRTATGRTPIYDFDEWNNAHYGGEFKNQMKIKQKRKERQAGEEAVADGRKNEIVIMVMVCLIFLIAFGNKNYDVDKTKDRGKDSK